MQSTIAVGDHVQTDPLLNLFFDKAYDEAQLLATGGRIADAMDVYARIGVSQAERLYQDALVLEQKNNVPKTIGLLKCCVAANPGHIPASVKLSNFLSESEAEKATRYGSEAEKTCRQDLDAVPDNLGLRIRLVNLLISSNRRVEAARVLAGAKPSTTENYDTQFALFNLFWQLGDFSAAEYHLRRCIQMNNGDAHLYQSLLELLNLQDRLTDAEELCRDYLKLKPYDHPMRVSLSQVFVRQQRWTDAEEVFLDLLEELPDWIQLRQLYARMLEKSGQIKYAIDIFEKNVAMRPSEPEAYLHFADIQHKSGEKNKALNTCNLATRLFLESENLGFHALPNNIKNRLIFYHLETVAQRYCTGQRAIFDNTEINLNQANFEFGEVVEFFCMVTGKEHIDYLEHVAYPALSLTEGFDELLKERVVIYNIYTTPADFKLLQGFLSKLSQRGIRYRVNVELFAFSQEIYPILVLPIIDQVKRSLALRSIVVMALPDAIISGSIYRVINDMKPFETVVCAMPRIDSEIAYPELKKFFSEAGGKGLDSREFVRRSMTDFMHPQTYSALISENNCLRYRDEGTYYSARNWAPPPLCFYAREEMLDHMLRNPLCGPNSMASFYAIDHDFVDSAYRTNNLRLIGDSDYFYWAEFTHQARHAGFLSGRQSEDYYSPESAKYIFQHEFKWIYKD